MVLDKFYRYIAFDTQSDENSKSVPSTSKQLQLAQQLKKECIELGFDSVTLAESGIVYGTINATKEDDAIGFLAHMDTALECSGKNVKAQRIQNYDGSVIRLNENLALDPAVFEELQKHVGHTLITTDGHTLLGGDDKAGIAILMQAMEEIIQSHKPHGKIMVAFTVDENLAWGRSF